MAERKTTTVRPALAGISFELLHKIGEMEVQANNLRTDLRLLKDDIRTHKHQLLVNVPTSFLLDNLADRQIDLLIERIQQGPGFDCFDS